MGISHHKRKRAHNPILNTSAELEDFRIDKAYASYLGKLGLSELGFVEAGVDDDDHTYMMFLEDLKGYGKAYMLDVSLKNGVEFPIWYEVENDDPCVEPNLTNPGSCGVDSIREVETVDVDMQSGEENSSSVEEISERDALIKKWKGSALSHELKMMVEGNILRRSPRILEISSKAQELDVHGDLVSKQDVKNPTLVRERRVSAPDGKLHSSLRNSKENSFRLCPRDLQEKQDCMANSKADIVDEAYRAFVSGVKVVGDCVFYEYGDGQRVYYEGSDECMQDNVDGETLDNGPIPQIMTPRPQTPSPRRPSPPPRLLTPPTIAQTPKEDGHKLRTSAVVTQSWKPPPNKFAWFWKALEKDLRRPFERKEYESLLEEVNARKPIKVHKDTRSGGYDKDSKLGNSYLDLYPDLKDEIKKVEYDPYKVMNLLRGFFFFLQKLPHGVPPPWRDNRCKTIMLGTRYG